MSLGGSLGTIYYGWRHRPDGTATATRWFAFLWLPIIPLQRQHLRVVEIRDSVSIGWGGVVGKQHDSYELLERLPLCWKEVGLTLAKAYLGLPLLLLGPTALLVVVELLLKKLGFRGIPPDLVPVFIMLGLAGFLWQVIIALRKARGMRMGRDRRPLFPDLERAKSKPVLKRAKSKKEQ